MKKNVIKVKAKGWWKLYVAIIMAGIGLAICYIGNERKDPIIIALGFGLLLVGVLLFFSKRGELDTRILPGGKKLAKPANSLVLSAGDIEFDYIKNPPGHQQRCINDGKWYSVLIRKEGENLQAYELPDVTEETRYYDPREFSNPVTMPANKKLFEPRPNMIKTIAVGVMGLAVVVLGVVIVAMSG